jgi:hypothetical protein
MCKAVSGFIFFNLYQAFSITGMTSMRNVFILVFGIQRQDQPGALGF